MHQSFGIGAVLATTFRVWARNLVPFVAISALLASPLILWGVVLVQGQVSVDQLERFSLVSDLAALVLNVLVGAALTYGVVMELQGRRATLSACIGTGLRRLLPALGVSLLSVLAILGGLLLLIVPGVIVACMLFVATQASVVERPGLTGALRRSRALTAGHRLEILGLWVVLVLLSWAAGELVDAIFLPGDPARFGAAVSTLMYVELAQDVVMTSLGAVMSAVAYSLLRAEKEGASASDLARVFE